MKEQLHLKSQIALSHKLRARRGRRQGIAIVYFAIGVVTFVGAAALAVDMGHLYNRRAVAQKAADAAALGGAYRFATFQASNGAPAYAHSTGHWYAAMNGYDGVDPYTAGDTGVAGVTVTTTYPVAGMTSNNFRVTVRRDERLFFAQIFRLRTAAVSASATAQYTTLAPMSINGGGAYGQPDGPTSLSMFGPDAYYNNGDNRSVRYLANGTTPNPDYDGKGYDFTVNVPVGYGTANMEIFDPDCYNAGGNANAQAGVRVDELRTSGGGAGTSSNATTTRYRLYYDNNTPENVYDDVLVTRTNGSSADLSYGNTSTTDMKWNSVFTFNRANYGAGNFRLNATTTGGSSENGFNLRVKKNGVAFTADPVANPTSISAQGYLPMNFNQSGTATIELGSVPVQAAGSTLEIRKFDTDVGGQTVAYSYVTAAGAVVQMGNGVLSGNGEFTTDSISLPNNYPGGTWRATYTAGAQDTSVWNMSYSGFGPGQPGRIRLVR